MIPYFAKYGTFTRINPWAKEFYVLKASGVEQADKSALLTPDNEGIQRLHTSISDALGQCVASRGDVVHVLPGHTETLTAALTVSVAGVSIIGHGRGTLQPTLTVNGAVDGISVTGANVLIENIGFAAPETDEATAMINVAAAGVTLRNVFGIGSQTSKNFVDCVTLASGGDDCTIEGLRIYNTTVAVNSFISIEAAVARLSLLNVRCIGPVVAGGLIDAATATHLFMEDVRIVASGTTKPAATLDSNPTGFARNCFFAGTDTTIANNAALGTGLRVDNIKVLEETDNSKSAMILPAVDVD